MSTTKEEAGPSKSWDSTTGEPEVDNRTFECNICLDTAKDAVISMCGHLFCWPCLHQWLETRPLKRVCPVCKATISREKVIPLYGRGDTRHEDPRNNVPPRPTGQRTEPESNGFSSFGFGDNSFMSFGIGTFPFAFLTSTFNFGETRPSAEIYRVFSRLWVKPEKSLFLIKRKAPCICLGKLQDVTSFACTDYICDLYENSGDLRTCSSVAPTGTSHYEEEQFLSKVFLWVALVFICWLLMA